MTEHHQQDRRREDELKHELDEIRTEVYKKQDKIKMYWVIPIIIWALTQTIGGVWWAATMSAQLDALSAIVEAGTTDRYRGAQAQADFALRDEKIDFLQMQIDRIRDADESHHKMPAHTAAIIEHEHFKEHMNNKSIHGGHQ